MNQSTSNSGGNGRRLLNPIPDKVIKKVYEEILKHCDSVDTIPQKFYKQSRRSLGIVRCTERIKFYWLSDYRKIGEILVTTFPKNILKHLRIIEENGKWNIKDKMLFMAIMGRDGIENLAACSVDDGTWKETYLCPEKSSAMLLNEEHFDNVPKTEPLYVSDNVLSALQLSALGLPSVGMLGEWPLPVDKLVNRRIVVAVKISSYNGRGISSTSWKLRKEGIVFEEQDQAKLELSWILKKADGELAAHKPKFWQTTIEKLFNGFRKSVLKLGWTKDCTPCEQEA